MKTNTQFRKLLSCFLVSVLCTGAWAQDGDDLSLSDLLNLEVDAGNLTGLKGNKVPVPITVITKEDIAKTPYRNMVDLIEAYVPGAFQVSHQVPLLGMRGIVVDRNYKWLLLVNGRLMNQRAAEGAIEEIRHFTLDDVERIEVIRGPGSVTYGPGAVSGVVNVVTKTGETTQGLEVTSAYDNAYYMRSLGVGYGFTAGPVKGYVYAGGQYQDGADATYMRVDSKTGKFGVMGEDVDTGKVMQKYYGSVEDKPFLKLHLDLIAFNDWRLWARYTQANGPQMIANMNEVDYKKGGLQNVPTRFTEVKSFTSVLENKNKLNEMLTMTTQASFKTEDYLLSALKLDTVPYDQGIADLPGDSKNGNTVYSFAEHEGYFKGLLNADFTDKYKGALGGSFSFQSFMPRWASGDYEYAVFQPKNGKDGEGVYYAEREKYGYGTMMGSVFGEANLGFHPLATALLSMRVDKHQWSEPFYSPRLGVISEINSHNVAKIFWQRSLRMNTTSDMYREYINGQTSKPEELQSVEVSYMTSPMDNLDGSVYGFYNTLEVIGWNANTNKTEAVGDLKYWGAEAELKYENKKYKVGLNHSLVSLIDWKMASGVTSQGISQSDYNHQTVKTDSSKTLKSTGESLNNVPEQVSKLFATVHLPYNLWAHTDLGVQWGFQGFKDAQTMYDNMLVNDTVWTKTSAALDAEDYAEMEVRLNASLGYDLPSQKIKGTVMIYAMNILEQNTHTYSSGNKTLYPEKLQWIEEPRTFGVRLNLQY